MTREEFILEAQKLADSFTDLLDKYLEDKKHLYATRKVGKNSGEGNILHASISVSYQNDDSFDVDNLNKALSQVEVYGNLDTISQIRFYQTDDCWREHNWK